MKAQYTYVLNNKSVTIYKTKDGNYKEKTIFSNKFTNAMFDEIKDLVQSNQVKAAWKKLKNHDNMIINYHGYKINVTTRKTTYMGNEINFSKTMIDELIGMVLETSKLSDVAAFQENNIDKFFAFMGKLEYSESFHILDELYDFIKYNDIDIDESGYVICYKIVNSDYTDCYTSSIDNSVGQVVKMERSKISDNRNESCSFGLHAASLSYLKRSRYGYSDDAHLMKIKIHPADFVSVPYDYNGAKARVCKYEVIEEVDLSLISNYN